MKLSEQLSVAIASEPTSSGGYLIKVLKLDNGKFPAQEMQGVLPVVVVGHEAMTEVAWGSWVRRNAEPHYGSDYASKMVGGFDFREMDPTRAFGRAMRKRGIQWEGVSNYYVDNALFALTVVDKWPSLYNLIATEMAEETMTVTEFVRRVNNLPPPREAGEGRSVTLGDFIGRNVTITPNF